MSNVIGLLGACLVLGALARRSGRFPEAAPVALNAFVLNVALPALVLRAVHGLAFAPGLLLAAATPWLVFLMAFGLFRGLGGRLGLSRDTAACLVLTGGLSNTAFVGLPMAEALLGHAALGVAVVVDQLGSFMVLGTLATLFAARASAEVELDTGALLKRFLVFPPFLALVLGLVLRPFAYPGWVEALLERLGDMLTPLALFSVGFQLRLGRVHHHVRPLVLGLGYKLVLAPAVIALLVLGIPGMPSLTRQTIVLQAAMAPMVSGAILAAEHDLDPELSALMVGIGIPLSFALAPLSVWLMR
jgi:hypothetical protein